MRWPTESPEWLTERKGRPDWAAAMPRWARLLLGAFILFWIVVPVVVLLIALATGQ